MPDSPAKPRGARFAIFEVDFSTRELRRNGIKIKLQDQPFQVLAALLERPGELSSREELRKRIWPDDTFVDFDHGLNTAVKKLREALNDSATTPRFVETLPKLGYRFIAPVTFIASTDSQANIAQTPASTAAPALNHAISSSPVVGPAAEALPRPPRLLPRFLFVLAQVMYLCFYVAALANADDVNHRGAVFGSGLFTLIVVIVTAATGIPIRLFMLNAVAFDYTHFGAKFQRLFPWVLLVDIIWALSPFLLVHRLRWGLALAICAALAYLPFGERTLVQMAYPRE